MISIYIFKLTFRFLKYTLENLSSKNVSLLSQWYHIYSVYGIAFLPDMSTSKRNTLSNENVIQNHSDSYKLYRQPHFSLVSKTYFIYILAYYGITTVSYFILLHFTHCSKKIKEQFENTSDFNKKEINAHIYTDWVMCSF